MVSSLDTNMHMQLQTAACAQGVCTQPDAACAAERLKFIHACKCALLSYVHCQVCSQVPCSQVPCAVDAGAAKRFAPIDQCQCHGSDAGAPKGISSSVALLHCTR